jgi:Helix-turn-helix domain
MGDGQMNPGQIADGLTTYTIKEVAQRLRVSARWLADECRAERIEHVHIARQRRFTEEQIRLLLAKKTVVPAVQKETDATRERVLRMLARH